MEGQEVNLESDYVYQFMLQYQQDIDINESYGAYIAGRTPAEMKMKAEFLTIDKKFYANKEYLIKIGERIERGRDKPYKGYYNSEYPDINTHCYKPEGMTEELFAKKKMDGKCKSRAFQSSEVKFPYTTRYSLMITATGKPVKPGEDQTSFEIQVGANKGYQKIRTD